MASKHTYIAEKAKGFRTRLSLDEDREFLVQFADGRFDTDDSEIADALDQLLANGSAICRFVRKVDRGLAEELAKQHLAQMRASGAVKGGMTAAAAKTSMTHAMADRDHALQAQDIDVEEVAKVDDLILTEAVDLEKPLLKFDLSTK